MSIIDNSVNLQFQDKVIKEITPVMVKLWHQNHFIIIGENKALNDLLIEECRPLIFNDDLDYHFIGNVASADSDFGRVYYSCLVMPDSRIKGVTIIPDPKYTH